MTASPERNPSRRIGFVSTRIAGHDGVSLEIEKWAEILGRLDHSCYYIAGECDRPSAASVVIPEMHFKHPEIDAINERSFDRNERDETLGSSIRTLAARIKSQLGDALRTHKIDLVIAENCLTIPMNIPLGLALVELVMDSGLPCIAHHHDFVWERERYFVSSVEDYLMAAFPPPLSVIQHIAINRQASREFSRRTGLSCRVIPNVMDFETPPPESDEAATDLRQALGIEEDGIMFLQPTRLVPRKGIEHAIELLHTLQLPGSKLVISHASGDEGDRYALRIERYARMLGVDVVFADRWFDSNGEGDGRRFTLEDAYRAADFVTYPSTYEGFGNAFLEAIYFKKPLLCNRYAIYRTDIEPCGFDVVVMDGFLTDDVIGQVRTILADPSRRSRMVDHNYEVGLRYFSYARAETELSALLARPLLAKAAFHTC